MNNPKFYPLGDRAITIDFGNVISLELNESVLRLARFFEENPFAGFVEIVPAYSSLTVFYDVVQVRKIYPNFATAFDAVKNLIEKALLQENETQQLESRLVEIPVCFDREFALDLEFVAAQHKISTAEVIKIFLAQTYRVFMLGFLPGFSYMGEIDERIVTPRKPEPRLKTPEGSVGIAGKQTGIYSLESPGGWQIIGNTPIPMFNSKSEQPTFLQAGDEVQFYEIGKEVFTTEAQRHRD